MISLFNFYVFLSNIDRILTVLNHTGVTIYFFPASINTLLRFRKCIAISFRQILLEFGGKIQLFMKINIYKAYSKAYFASGSINFDNSNSSEGGGDVVRAGAGDLVTLGHLPLGQGHKINNNNNNSNSNSRRRQL